MSAGLLLAPAASSSPDGADWIVAGDPEGCGACHLSESGSGTQQGLAILGLPDTLRAGDRYELTIALDDPALRNAGFLISVQNDGSAPGELSALDERVETSGAQARSTWEGSFPEKPGTARWDVLWIAPESLAGVFRFDVWANAGNDDLSPLGDTLHHRIYEIDASR
jgi:hypothetical protein